MLACPVCGTENGLDANDREDGKCRSCKTVIKFPTIADEEDVLICYECLRAGKGAMTKNTEFGMVSWEQAFQGVTHGLPGLHTDEFERVLVDPEDEWYGVRMPSEHLFELLRTPTYTTWQGEDWQFCCKRPMTYIGDWSTVSKALKRGGNPQTLFETIVGSSVLSREVVWARVLEGSISLYVFECKACGRKRSHWDMD